MKIVYFEDLHEGDVFWGDEVIVDPEEMLAYNQQNEWPIHVDEEAAQQSPFGGIIASGGYTITLMYRSLLGIYNNPEVRWEFLGGLDWKLKFLGPVRPGDRLRCKMTIKSVRPSSKGPRRSEQHQRNDQSGRRCSHVAGRYIAADNQTGLSSAFEHS